MLATCLFALIAVPVIVWGWINLVGPFKRRALQVLIDEHTPEDAPAPEESVVVLVPARNEADHLRSVLTGLCEQDHPHYEVVLINDASTDATGAIADELAAVYPHLHVLHLAEDPPAGWVGKNWALHQGYQWWRQGLYGRADAPPVDATTWVCFTDADVHWAPALLRLALVHAKAHRVAMVSLLPGLDFGSTSEAIVQLQMMLALHVLMPMDKASDPADARSIAAGAFMLMQRDWYEHLGGHEAVADKVVEDINLARLFKQHGAPMRVALARQHLRCRMYDGFAAQWEGLTKNAFAGLDYSLWKAGLVVVGALIANVLPPVYWLIALIWCVLAPTVWSGAALVLASAAVILPARALNKVRQVTDLPFRYAATMSLGSGLYVLILLVSMWRSWFGGNRWKGRAYKQGAA
jgi:chlorobactene glucosyltransferase